MPINGDLKKIEKKAFQIYNQDGLLDIFIGVIFLLWAVGPLIESYGLPRAGIELGYILLLLVFIYLGKRVITIPRIGIVKFRSVRRAYRNQLVVVTSIAVAIIMLIMLLALTNRFPKIFGQTFGGNWGLFIEGGIYVLVSLIIAFTMGFPRMILYGIILGINIPMAKLMFGEVLTVTGCLVLWGIPGLIILAIGVGLLIRFVLLFPRSIPTDHAY